MMHELYLIRHGLAEDRGEAWPDDEKRPLTSHGVARLKKEARGLARLGVQFDVILTSPLVRTRQTAEVVAAAFDPRPPVVTSDGLSPDAPAQALLTDLEKHSRRERIALIGHEPGIGELAGRLAGLRRPLPFKKGAVCRIDVDALPPSGAGTLRWFVTPKILRALRKS
ncbi:MAG: phosphohistidine phosphatase SixA [Betaproteobacteria bacterium]